MLKLSNAPILWGSKRQTVVALSTCAAEYIALSDLTRHLVQAINQLAQLAQDFKKMIFCDNQAVVQVSIDNLSRKRIQMGKHLRNASRHAHKMTVGAISQPSTHISRHYGQQITKPHCACMMHCSCLVVTYKLLAVRSKPRSPPLTFGGDGKDLTDKRASLHLPTSY
ncbi:hypothetical protein O181_021305 [Austropuccinia psidii MF-1]|uniref:Uncharacterized protein n=1 Tax=Austropuccinia psidii MF-1 TaxID=1389203 RepID=A0A9Q3CFI8_9BASI|nr:hypothetical protein [Austropuccinia psidii MF-1]